MLDFDDMDEAEEAAGLVMESEGDPQPLPAGKWVPPQWTTGRGTNGKLKLLCFHGMDANAAFMKLQMTMNFMDKECKDLVEFEYVESEIESPKPKSPEQAVYRETMVPSAQFGPHKTWFDKDGISPDEVWKDFGNAIETVAKIVVEKGPVDGLCGFSAGGELCCQIARLAEEGRPELQDKFRFLLCMSTRFPKEFNASQFRPKTTMRVPLFHTCSREDDQASPLDFDDLVLHWDPSRREVVWHTHGHRIPKYADTELERLRRFIKAFHSGEPWEPIMPGPHDPIAGKKLPLEPSIPAKLRAPSPAMPIQVFCFDDVLGSSGQVGAAAFEAFKNAVGESSLAGAVSWEIPQLDPTTRPPETPQSPMHIPQHVVPDILKGDVGPLLIDLSKEERFTKSPAVVIGIGWGAWAALHFAQALSAREDGLVWRFYAVFPPVIFKTPDEGCLRACSMTCVLPRGDTGGTWWRFEMVTHGPFKVHVLPRGSTDWSGFVLQDLIGAFEKDDD